MRVVRACLVYVVLSTAIALPAYSQTTPQALPYVQDWSDPAAISVDDDWSGVPGVIGYGDVVGSAGADPQAILSSGTLIDVIEGSSPTSSTGGVHELEVEGAIALQGSGGAEAPHLQFHVATTSWIDIKVSYTLRELDASSAIQPVALQYRVGVTGDFVNLPSGYVADASDGTGLTTSVSATSLRMR